MYVYIYFYISNSEQTVLTPRSENFIACPPSKLNWTQMKINTKTYHTHVKQLSVRLIINNIMYNHMEVSIGILKRTVAYKLKRKEDTIQRWE